MKTLFRFSCAAIFLFLCLPQVRASSLCALTAGNLVSNCGFETGSFSSWTLTGNDTPGELDNLYGVEGTDPFDSMGPNSGSFQAFFGDLDSNSTTLSQTIATTVGKVYTITYYLAQDTAPGGAYTNALAVSFDGISLVNATGVPVSGYTDYSYTVKATTASSVLSMKFGDDLGEFLLDDVTVVQKSPEPAAWMLMLGGATLVVVFRRKRGNGAAR